MAGEALFEKSYCAGTRRACMDWGQRTKQKTELAGAGAEEETVLESRLKATSDQSQMSGLIEDHPR